jgi:hypothetical protein
MITLVHTRHSPDNTRVAYAYYDAANQQFLLRGYNNLAQTMSKVVINEVESIVVLDLYIDGKYDNLDHL